MENTTRPWVIIAVGVCGLLSVGVLLKHFGGSDSEETRSAERLAQIVAERARSGQRPSSDEGSAATGSSGPRVDAKGKTSSPGDLSQGGADDADGATILLDEAGVRRGGRVGAASARRDGSLTVGGDMATGSRGTAAEALARRSREARDRIAQSGRVAGPGGTTADGHEAIPDPETPVFSALKDGKLETESGASPLAADKLESKDGQVMFGADSKFVVPDAGNVQGKAGAISFWVTPEWDGTDKGDAHLVDLEAPNTWENRLAINKNGRYLRFMFFPSSGEEAGVSATIDNWQAQQPHHVAAEWGPQEDGANVLQFYVDGKLVGSQHYKGDFNVPQVPMIIGNNQSGQLGARAGLSSVEVYNTTIEPERISSLYGSGQQKN